MGSESAYNPELWALDRPRQSGLVQLGAILLPEYRDFLASKEFEDLTDPELVARSVGRLNQYRVPSPLSDEFHHLTGEDADTLSILLSMATLTADASESFASKSGFTNQITDEQYDWIRNNTFYGKYRDGLRDFQSHNMNSVINAMTYFAASYSASELVHEDVDNDATMLELISQPGFQQGVRNAMRATRSYWRIADTIHINDFGQRESAEQLFISTTTSGPASMESLLLRRHFDDSGTLDPVHVEAIKSQRKAAGEDDSSSGCPLRHRQLGHNIITALTEDQRERLREVATIKCNGSIDYTWDPVESSFDYFVPRIQKAVKILVA